MPPHSWELRGGTIGFGVLSYYLYIQEMNLNPLQKLDEVLKIISIKNNAPATSFYKSDIIAILKTSFDFNDAQVIEITNQIPQIIGKLLKDGNITLDVVRMKKEVLGNAGRQSYIITFEGQLFLELGGYKEDEKRKSKKATLQFWQTWAIAVGTALAGIYGLYEIVKGIIALFSPSC